MDVLGLHDGRRQCPGRWSHVMRLPEIASDFRHHSWVVNHHLDNYRIIYNLMNAPPASTSTYFDPVFCAK